MAVFNLDLVFIMISYLQTDIFKAPIDLLGHVANCQCVMGAGIALQIKNKFPEVYEADLKTKKGVHKLGRVGLVKVKPIPGCQITFVANCYAQEFYGREKRQLDYEAFYQCLEKLRIANTNLVIGFPHKIGCQNAGGDWGVVESMIWSVFESSPRQVVICRNE